MSAPVVRAHYDELGSVANTFRLQADQTRKTLQQLRGQKETLKGGDWVGMGAQAFYAEMDSQILPTVNRLIQALEKAADTTQQINQVVRQAEADAAALFKVNGVSDNSALGGAIGPADFDVGEANSAAGSIGAAGGMAASANAFVAARPGGGNTRRKPVAAKGSGGTGAGAHRDRFEDKFIIQDLEQANPALADQVKKDPNLKREIERLSEAHWHIEKGDSGGVAIDYGDQTITLGPDASLAKLTKDVQRIRDNPAILENSGLSAKAIEQIKKDPVLMAQVRLLGERENSQWKIQMGTDGGVSMTRFGSNEVIVLNPDNPVGSLRSNLHTAFRGEDEESLPLNKATSREHYVDFNSDSRLYNDANQMLMTYEAQHEAAGTMPNTLPNGHRTTNPAAYQQVVTDYWSGKINYAAARGQLHDLMTHEPAGITDQQKYADEYRKKWDAAHKPSK